MAAAEAEAEASRSSATRCEKRRFRNRLPLVCVSLRNSCEGAARFRNRRDSRGGRGRGRSFSKSLVFAIAPRERLLGRGVLASFRCLAAVSLSGPYIVLYYTRTSYNIILYLSDLSSRRMCPLPERTAATAAAARLRVEKPNSAARLGPA